MPSHAEVLGFLFRLASQAHRLPPTQLRRRLVTGLANRFGASGCSVHGPAAGPRCLEATPDPVISNLPPMARAALQNLETRLVRETIRRRQMVSAVDLDDEEDVVEFLEERLAGSIVLGFPLVCEGGVRGALVLYLPRDAPPVGDADVQALMAVGEILELTETPGA